MTNSDELADALERADWSGVSIGNKVMLKGAIDALRGVAQAPRTVSFDDYYALQQNSADAHNRRFKAQCAFAQMIGWKRLPRIDGSEFEDETGAIKTWNDLEARIDLSPVSSTLHSPPEFLARSGPVMSNELADRIEKSQPIIMIGGAECPDVRLHPKDWREIVAALRAGPAATPPTSGRLTFCEECNANRIHVRTKVINGVQMFECPVCSLAATPGPRCGGCDGITHTHTCGDPTKQPQLAAATPARNFVQEHLERSLSEYDKTIDRATDDGALSETGREMIFQSCRVSKSAIRAFAERLQTYAALAAPQAQEAPACKHPNKTVWFYRDDDVYMRCPDCNSRWSESPVSHPNRGDK